MYMSKTQDPIILQHAEYQTQSSRYSFPPFYKFKAVFFLAFDFLQYYNTSVKKFYQSRNTVTHVVLVMAGKAYQKHFSL